MPGLVLLAGFSLTAAAGTSLAALLLPVGAIGALEYWRTGQVDLPAAASTVKSASRRTACASSSSTAAQVSELVQLNVEGRGALYEGDARHCRLVVLPVASLAARGRRQHADLLVVPQGGGRHAAAARQLRDRQGILGCTIPFEPSRRSRAMMSDDAPSWESSARPRDFRASVMLRLPVQIVVGWPQAWTCTMIEVNVGAA